MKYITWLHLICVVLRVVRVIQVIKEHLISNTWKLRAVLSREGISSGTNHESRTNIMVKRHLISAQNAHLT